MSSGAKDPSNAAQHDQQKEQHHEHAIQYRPEHKAGLPRNGNSQQDGPGQGQNQAQENSCFLDSVPHNHPLSNTMLRLTTEYSITLGRDCEAYNTWI
jgi:hypothetical protein